MEEKYGQMTLKDLKLLFSDEIQLKTILQIRIYKQIIPMAQRSKKTEIFDSSQWFSREQWQLANLLLEQEVQEQWSFSQLIDSNEIISEISIGIDHEHSTGQQEDHSTTSRNKRERNIDLNYEKNICAYITKKAVQCFVSRQYSSKVRKMCEKNSCEFEEVMAYYNEQYLKVFGITLLSVLITPLIKEQIGMKLTFLTFFKWFLREKYMFYLLKFGKMSEKEKYIEFKNKYLLYIETAEESISQSF